MSLYIDPPNAAGHGRMWSHLASDEVVRGAAPVRGVAGHPRAGVRPRPLRHSPPTGTPRSSRRAPRRSPAASWSAGCTPRACGAASGRAPRRAPRALLRAHRLRPGDASPWWPRPARSRRTGSKPASRRCPAWGLEVRVGPHVRGRHPDAGYLAAADADRAAGLPARLVHPQVQAVFCARGGYGVQRMVDLLDWSVIAAAGPKVLVGFSDITALHQAFAARLGMSTRPRPGGDQRSLPRRDSAEHLRTLLFEPEALGSLTPVPTETMVARERGGPADRRQPRAAGRPRPGRGLVAGPRRDRGARGRRRGGLPDRPDADPAAAGRLVRRGARHRARPVHRERGRRRHRPAWPRTGWCRSACRWCARRPSATTGPTWPSRSAGRRGWTRTRAR